MTITICVTSDLHGRMDRLELIHKHIEQIRPDILIDNGDFLQGSMSTFYYDYIAQQTPPMLALANDIGYDVAIFGNHEFNYPLSSIENMRNSCNFPWIAGNIGDFAKPYIIKETQNKRVAIIGVTTHFTPLWDEQQHTRDLTFTDALQAANDWVQYVHTYEKPDYIIVSYHGGFTSDPVTGAHFATDNGENQANEMLQIPYVDALITGHQHLQIATVVNNIPVIQPGANGCCVGMITLGDQPSATLFPIDKKAQTFPQEVDAWLQQPLTHTELDLTYHGLLQSRIHQPKFVDFLHDVQLSATSAELSLIELMFHEQGGFTGTVTNLDVLRNISRPNTLKVLLLTGHDIKSAIEQSAAALAINNNGDIDFSFNVYSTPQPYMYDYFGGLHYTINLRQPVGERAQLFQLNGEPFDLQATYRVVMNSYRATGTDFKQYANKPCVFETKQLFPLLIMSHLQTNGVTNNRFGSITITTS